MAAKGSLAAAAAGNRLRAAAATDGTAAAEAGHERGADLETAMAAAQASGCTLSPSLLTLDPGAAWERGGETAPHALHKDSILFVRVRPPA